MLNRDVFPTIEAGNYFNNKFIIKKYQLNRSDPDGIIGRYGIRVYPTFIFVNSDGKELTRMIGSKVRDTRDLIEKIEIALSKENSLVARDSRFKSEPSYAIEHIQFLFDSSRDIEANESLEIILNKRSIKDNFNSESVNFYKNSIKDIESPIIRYMSSNKKKIVEIVGNNEFTSIMHNIANEYICAYAYGNKYSKDNLKNKLDEVGENKMLKSHFYKFICEVEDKSENRDLAMVIDIANKYNKKSPSKDRFMITRFLMISRSNADEKVGKENLMGMVTFLEQASIYEKDVESKKSYAMFAKFLVK